MNNSPVISIIVPVYNSAKYIERCVVSLMEQTIQNAEFIFVDDCSTDNTISIIKHVVKKYPNRQNIQFLRNEHNSGPSVSRNYGLAAAHGEFIAFCDSDDWVERNMYESMLDCAHNADADLVSIDYIMEYNNTQTPIKIANCKENRIEYINSVLESDVSTFSVLYISKRSLFQLNNLKYPENIAFAEDYNLVCKLIYFANSIAHVEKKMYHYFRDRSDSLVSSFNEKSRTDALKSIDDVIQFYSNKGIEHKVERGLSWKILKFKQEYILNKCTWNEFLSIYPKSKSHILSCPWCNWKNKILMWTLTHKMRGLTELLLFVRSIKSKI